MGHFIRVSRECLSLQRPRNQRHAAAGIAEDKLRLTGSAARHVDLAKQLPRTTGGTFEHFLIEERAFPPLSYRHRDGKIAQFRIALTSQVVYALRLDI